MNNWLNRGLYLLWFLCSWFTKRVCACCRSVTTASSEHRHRGSSVWSFSTATFPSAARRVSLSLGSTHRRTLLTAKLVSRAQIYQRMSRVFASCSHILSPPPRPETPESARIILQVLPAAAHSCSVRSNIISKKELSSPATYVCTCFYFVFYALFSTCISLWPLP